MKMARASDDDIQGAIDLLNLLDEWDDYGTYTPEDDSETLTNDRLVELIGEIFEKHPGGLSRVIHGYRILRDNCTDPNLTYLDWKPEIKAAMEKVKGGNDG